MQEDETVWPWLVLHLTPGVGGVRVRQLLEQYGAVTALPQLTANDLVAIGWPQRVADTVCRGVVDPAVSVPGFKRLLQWAAEPENNVLTPHHAYYPERLLSILHDPPPVLFARGNCRLLQRPMVAIVGSRNPLPVNRQLAFDWAAQLASASLVVLSGLAQGIDGAAHRGAVAAHGPTLAVLGSGLERVYPLSHIQLAQEMVAAGGLILSEFSPETPPSPGHFPRRNRLVAALADVVLVVEAAAKSGSLITARLAAEYGKEVMAVPGHPNYAGSRGTNMLIANGAGLAATAADVAFSFADIQLAEPIQPTLGLPPLQQQILAALSFEPMALETLALAVAQPLDQLLVVLLELELEKRVETIGGCYVRL